MKKRTKKYTIEEVRKYLINYDLILLDEEYINNKTKISVKDINGYKFSFSFGEFVQYHKKIDKFSVYNPYTIDNIKLFLKLNKYDNKLISDEYKNSDEKLLFTCANCGEFYNVSFKHFRNANQTTCKKCSIDSYKEQRKMDFKIVKDLFISKGYVIDENIVNESNFKGCNHRIDVVDANGYKGVITYSSLAISNGINIFSKENPYTIENIRHYIEINNLPCKLLSDKYNGKRGKLNFQCKCGAEYSMAYDSFRNNSKYRCDKCSQKQSYNAYLVATWLKENCIAFETEYKFNDCRNKNPLPFDFAIIEDNKLKMLIEVDGKQHYEVVKFNGCNIKKARESFYITVYHDAIKNSYCEDKNIDILRIPYWDIANKHYINILNNKLKTHISL